MANTNETVTDIIAEMRSDANADEYTPDGILGQTLNCLADRLEAAYKREIDEPKKQLGNVAKLREALIKARSAICHFARHQCQSLSWENSNIQASCGDVLCPWRGLCKAKTAINAALAAPARNCDIYATVEEARKVWCGAPSRDWDYLCDWLYANTKEMEATNGSK